LAENHLPFRGMSFVFLALNKAKLHDYHWIYYPDEEIPFQRLTEFSHFGAGMEPPGKTGVTLEVSCTPGDAVWSLSDRDTAQLCIDGLVRLGHLRPEEVIEARVVRVTHAYPLQVRGFLEKSQALLDSIGQVRNLVSIGRQGLFRYCNMNECMEMALDVVPKMIEGNRDIRYTRDGTWQGVGVTDRYAAPQPVPAPVRR
jgi:protoporphyrinogen oxidase